MADHLESNDLDALEAPQPQSRLNPVRLVWRHKWILALGLVVGVALGTVYYSRSTPIYQSSAQVLVVKKTPDALPLPGTDARTGFSEDYLSTHMTLIRSPVIVGHAVKNAKLANLPSFAGRGDPTGAIIGALKVSREVNAGAPTTILNISFRSTAPDDAAIVINAVIDSYQQFLNNKYKNVTDETAKLITQANEILEKKLNQKQKEYDRFSLDHPLLWRSKDGLSVSQERLASLESRRGALLLQKTEIQGRLDAFEKIMKEGKHTQAELLAMIAMTPGRAGTDPVTTASALEERLVALELQEKSLEQDCGPNHPALRSARMQLAALRKQMGRMAKTSPREEETGRLDPVKTHLQIMKLELENTRMGAEALGKLLHEEQEKAAGLRSVEKQDESYRAEIARSQQLFDAIAKRVDEVSIIKNFAGGYEAETIGPPGAGGKVYPSLFLMLTTAAVLGLLAGFGLAYLAELSDQSFRTPEEIRRRLGLPVIGHIPHFEPKDDASPAAGAELAHLNPYLCAMIHPKSREAEAYRGVRTALYFSNTAGDRKVIQVTSPDKGDGKSTLVANLAVSIAQSEKKVIVIDADFRRPRIHKIFNVSGETGLASVINGAAELAAAIQPTAVPGLFVLPCGPIPPNPAELLTLPRFRELLAIIRDQYDFVIIDTPPLLAVTDPCVVVPNVDGVILTIRISKNARPHAGRAREILASLNATIVGVVVNGVGGSAGGYGYDSYRYGYSYYKSYYSNDKYESYYSEDEDEESSGDATKRKSSRSRKNKGFLSRLLGL